MTSTVSRPVRFGEPIFIAHEEHLDQVHIWPHDRLSAADVLALVSTHSTWPVNKRHNQRPRGINAVLSWLGTYPGDGWRERWLRAGADTNSLWINDLIGEDSICKLHKRSDVSSALRSLFVSHVILPNYSFLEAYKNPALFTDVVNTCGSETFDRIETAAQQAALSERYFLRARVALAKMVIRTGRDVDELTAADFYEYRASALLRHGSSPTGLHVAWDLLTAVGVLPGGGTLRRQVRRGPKSPAELIDRYGIKCRPVRDVLVRYLKERAPGIDYVTLRGLSATLANLFWADLERHHPGIASLNLPTGVADDWKLRLRQKPTADGPRDRETFLNVMIQVRSFYLDLQEWAVEDPSWVPWVAPSPVRRGDTDGLSKVRAKAVADMHQRVRERLPLLVELVTIIENRCTDATTLLQRATSVPIGAVLDHDGTRYERIRSARGITSGPDAVLLMNLSNRQPVNITRDEDETFWIWAMVETLRHSGVRIEELLELTQLALVSYTLPSTGEVVPLLQVVPSKSNEERLLLVSPELAAVLAAVITRLRRRNGGHVPLVARYDPHEAVTGPALPHLFQRQHGSRRDVIQMGSIRIMLNKALGSDLLDLAGHPLRYTPHDFRRMFTTEAVSNGLPVHIAAKILGHTNINTTQSYLAIFQDDLIRTYRHFLDTRRATRPSAEYRQPTDQEWQEFQQHFEERKVSLGSCARPYGTPCRHEHACIRCPVLRVDPAQRPRLAEIARNLTERITEARINGWHGEVQGLQISLKAAQDKLVALDRSIATPVDGSPTNLGIPIPRRHE